MNQVEYISHIRDKEPRFQSVETHLLETAVLAKRYASVVGLGKIGELLGLLMILANIPLIFNNI